MRDPGVRRDAVDGDVLTVETDGRGPRRLNPLNDVMFACLFDDVRRTGSSMKEFLSALLTSEGEPPIAEVISMKSEYSVSPEGPGQKSGRLDVRVKDSLGAIYDVEVQNSTDYMNERGLFYGSRLAARAFPPGKDYSRIPRVRMVDICDFRVREGSEEIVEPVQLVYKKGPREVSTDAFAIYHIQLPEFRRRYRTLESVGDDALLAWLYLFDRGYKSEEETEMLAQRSEGLRDFAERYGSAIEDPLVKSRYEWLEDARHEEASRLAFAERRGEERGLKTGEERGVEKNNLEVAGRLKGMGLSYDVIAAACGLTHEQIDALEPEEALR